MKKEKEDPIFNRREINISFSKNYNIQQLRTIEGRILRELELIRIRISQIRRNKQKWKRKKY